MADISFAEFIERERAKLSKRREEISAKQRELQDELDGIAKELAAIDAYEAAKAGKIPTTCTTTRRPRAAGTRAPRGSRQQSMLDALGRNPEGMSRGELIEHFGVKGNKSEEQSISNALNALKKAGKIGSKDGKYLPA